MVSGTSSEGARRKLTVVEVNKALKELPHWSFGQDCLVKTFKFSDFHRVMAFVNAVAWIAHRNDHHPDLSVHYGSCVVTYTTHDAGGVTAADVNAAAQVERLGAGSESPP